MFCYRGPGDERVEMLALSLIGLWMFVVGYYGYNRLAGVGLLPGYIRFPRFAAATLGWIVLGWVNISFFPGTQYGVYALLPLIFGVAYIYSFIIFAHIVHILAYGRIAKTSEVWPWYIAAFIFPVGVWIIQPKVNEILS
jgi:hypothetical protein